VAALVRQVREFLETVWATQGWLAAVTLREVLFS